ncbi:S-layer homology domain-containing protein [Paenibacillus sp. JDR-2]|uniref:S-layer homology domain-containing protein n=1 Tax=Paenibacillus sp. (strain JDR-2) TaxID=324057 RepID=UPI000166AF4C|nr:S-layer homology domain-containing protein [Paenibacillus sp. JDR-2]ACS99078.1 S-layer domain protein [Paenibacillus sp. JDR-2]
MTIKKKIIVSTIAASMAATAFAGIPLSSKGLAEKLGFSNTAYAATSSTDQLIAEANKWHDALGVSGLATLKTLRDVIKGLTPAEVKAIVLPVTSSIATKYSLSTDEKIAIEDLYINLLGFTYTADFSYFDGIQSSAGFDVLRTLADEADVSGLTFEDLAAYVLKVKTNLFASLDALSVSQVQALATNPLGVVTLVQNAIQAVPDTNDTASKLKQVFNYYGINQSKLTEAAGNLVVKVTTVNSTAIPNAINAVITAYLNTRNTGTGPSVPSTGDEDTGTVKVPTEVTELLGKLKDKLANATDAEKAAILAEAVQQATALVTKLSTFDLSGDVKVSNGQASVQVSSSSVLSAIAGIGEILKNVKELAPGVTVPAPILNLNLGNVAQDDVKIGLNNALIQEAIKAGLGGINLTVNGLSAVLPVGGQFNGAVDFNINKSKADSSTTGELKAASDVYSFGLTIGGQSVTSFAQPVTVAIPLGNVDGVDKELLSLAKIVDGKLVFQGGTVEGNLIVEHRDTFSQYVVVENKVSFTDIASVQSWAGRAIEVIAAKGAIEGKKAGVFAPKDNVTRAEFAKMLTRALDIDNSSAKEDFADVKDTDWSAPYIGAAAKLGIIQGRSATKFDPNAQITRAEMATMIARALKVTKGAQDVTDVTAALASFKDASSISASLKAGVAFASKNGIVIGNNGKFSPNASATRAEAAVMIYRAVNFK